MGVDDDPGLPIISGPASNGEYDPKPFSDVVSEAARRALEATDDIVRRRRVDRRRFLLGASGAAVVLLALDACSRDSRQSNDGGRYRLPDDAATDDDVARDVLGGDELIVDVQGHLLDYELNPDASDFGRVFPQAQCGEADPRDCFSIGRFLEAMFLRSDTNIAVLSAIPIVGAANPLTIEVMEETRRIAAAVGCDDRIRIQGQAVPNSGRLRAALDEMSEVAAAHHIVAWKAYTHAGGPGWTLDDSAGAKVGEAFIRRAVEIGVPTIAVHKGFSGGSRFASPSDIGPAAARHRDVRFLVYHSGYESGTTEGPFTVATAGDGVNRLLASMTASGIGPNENVYAEIGSTWFNVMRDPNEAAHVIGKLLKHVGDDNVLWGTDSIWYGSPQAQIQAFRALEIGADLQEQHGYPALTAERKAKILGLNAARLHGIDTATARDCSFTRDQIEDLRVALPGDNRPMGPTTAAAVRAHIAAHGGLI
ncbi:MAG: amidohydrolase family protein [Acidimicrobiales bacterium]